MAFILTKGEDFVYDCLFSSSVESYVSIINTYKLSLLQR